MCTSKIYTIEFKCENYSCNKIWQEEWRTSSPNLTDCPYCGAPESLNQKVIASFETKSSSFENMEPPAHLSKKQRKKWIAEKQATLTNLQLVN